MSAQLCRFVCLLFIVFALPSVYADHTTVQSRYAEQRQVFLELKEVIRAGDIESAKARRSEIKGYPLSEFLDYLILRAEVKTSDKPAELLDRINGFEQDKRLHKRLLGTLKNRSIEVSRWQDYKLAAAQSNAPNHPCDDLLAGFKTGQPKQFTETSRALWAEVGRHTENCDQAFAELLNSVSDVPTRALWSRTVTLIKRGDLELAGDLLRYFNKRDRRIVQAWIDGANNPQELLPAKIMRGTSVHHKEIASLLLRRWARKDLPAAVGFWRNHAERFGYTDQEIQATLAKYSVLAAKRGLPDAHDLLESAPASRDVRYWRVRMALQEKDWQGCIVRLDQLSKEEQTKTRWQYWRARCLEAQGFRAAANRVYESIANRFEYYGFLAADQLSQDYQIDTSTTVVDDTELHQLLESKNIIKAIEYFLAELPWEGRRVWNNTMKSSSKARFLAAAHLAASVGWFDRSVDAAITAGEADALSLVFPQAYANLVNTSVARYNVPAEFVYAVMRRESRFISDIKSSAGAVGLMQLMPATARQMGQQLGIKAPAWRLTESELNIELGVRYLEYVLGRFGNNLALASAAYNAGPSRVKKWIEETPVATDLWVETIPFDETRAYVQAVLFNTAVSEWVMHDGNVTRLYDRMNNVSITQLFDQ